MRNNEAIRSLLISLADAGRLTPDEVLKRARPKDSPLHDIFEWNDSEAARKYRLNQARELISSFDISITINRVEVNVQQFVRDPNKSTEEQGYVSVTSIKSDSDEAREFVSRELSIAKTYVDKTERFAALLGLTKDIRSLSDQLSELSHSMRK